MTDLTQLTDEALRPIILGDDRDEAERAHMELGRRVSEGYSSPFQYQGRSLGMLEGAALCHWLNQQADQHIDQLILFLQVEPEDHFHEPNDYLDAPK